MDNIYSEQYLKELFNEMARTYGVVNTLSSFGFNYLWRKVCVENAEIRDSDMVCDLMSGNGENAFHIRKRIGDLICIDFSEIMARNCKRNCLRFKFRTEVIIENVFNLKLPDNSVDRIICSFGLKTLNLVDRKRLIDLMISCLKGMAKFR